MSAIAWNDIQRPPMAPADWTAFERYRELKGLQSEMAGYAAILCDDRDRGAQAIRRAVVEVLQDLWSERPEGLRERFKRVLAAHCDSLRRPLVEQLTSTEMEVQVV